MPDGLPRVQQVPHSIRRHHLVAALGRSAFGLYIDLRAIADSAWPEPGRFPRGLLDSDADLVEMERWGVLIREGDDHFRLPEFEAHRGVVKQFYAAQGSKAKSTRGSGGQFTSKAGEATSPPGDVTSDRTGPGTVLRPVPDPAASVPDGRAAGTFDEHMTRNGVNDIVKGMGR